MQHNITTVLVANRGEIARRIIRSVHALGLRAVAVYSDADAQAAHVREADEAVRLGPAPAAESYLDMDAVVAAAIATGSNAVHPGYGFLSENAAFGAALSAAGIAFIGPGAEALSVMGDKITAKNHVSAAGVPITPGVAKTGLSDADLVDASADVGYPLLIKPSAGGGGQGMVEVHAASELEAGLASARRTARSAFGDDTLFLERLVLNPRHIEVQVLADKHGNTVHLGERECSLQRRHQKVIEEAPAPLLEMLDDGGAALRARLGSAAVEAARSVGYVGAGTVEFLVSNDNPDEFFFMEMNTRLQVEHPVTEEVARVRGERLDLVAWQIRIAAGESLDFAQDEVTLVGHATEARVYAERPQDGFLPAVGPVRAVRFPKGPGVRVDAALDGPGEVSAFYDPMIAKVIAWGPDREVSLRRLDGALAATLVAGAGTNLEYLRALLADEDVAAGRLDTGLIARKPGLTAVVSPGPAAAGLLTLAAAHLELREASGLDALAPLAPAVAVPGTQAGLAASGTASLSTAALGAGLASNAGSGWGGDGFRPAAPSAPVTVRLEAGEKELDAQVTLTAQGALAANGELRWNGGAVTRHAASTEQDVLLSLDGRSLPAVLVHTGGAAPGLWVQVNGHTHAASAPLRAERTRRAVDAVEVSSAGSDPRATAPMTGTVSLLAVQDGELVQEGQTLLAIEAMKMEHAVVAPLAGVVSLRAALGQQVSQGQVLALVEAVDAADAAESPEDNTTPVEPTNSAAATAAGENTKEPS